MSGRLGTAVPRLSIVVPAFNVESYLAECLTSLEAQTFTDTEVVIVDDGSTDGSLVIAEGFADRHPTWQVIRTENRGMGAARNVGVERARGSYLGFLDADDVLPPYAHELLVSTLEESGSDFAVGSLRRFAGSTWIDPAWLRAGHRRRRLGITLDELPPIMANVFAWTKVHRRSSYDKAGLTFPEGVRYEDQVASIEALLTANRFDVLKRPVYFWRIRADGTSVTQRRYELADLTDRFVTKHMTTDLVRRLGSAAVLDYWARNGLVGDLPLYFKQIPQCDEAYWQVLQVGMRDLFAGLPGIEESRLGVPQRLIGWLVASGRRTDAETVLRWVDEHDGPLATRLQDGREVACVPFLDDPGAGIPAEMFWMRQAAAPSG